MRNRHEELLSELEARGAEGLGKLFSALCPESEGGAGLCLSDIRKEIDRLKVYLGQPSVGGRGWEARTGLCHNDLQQHNILRVFCGAFFFHLLFIIS
jgi:hypothetical protein